MLRACFPVAAAPLNSSASKSLKDGGRVQKRFALGRVYTQNRWVRPLVWVILTTYSYPFSPELIWGCYKARCFIKSSPRGILKCCILLEQVLKIRLSCGALSLANLHNTVVCSLLADMWLYSRAGGGSGWAFEARVSTEALPDMVNKKDEKGLCHWWSPCETRWFRLLTGAIYGLRSRLARLYRSLRQRRRQRRRALGWTWRAWSSRLRERAGELRGRRRGFWGLLLLTFSHFMNSVS